MGERLLRSLEKSDVVDLGGYSYFIHPLTDGIPAIDPELLREVTTEILALVHPLEADRIVTVEAMGIPVATALSLATGVPLTVVRKRRYGLPGEVSIGQETGYAKGLLHLNGLSSGDRVLVLDDVISTGGTLSPLLEALEGMGVKVVDVIILIEKGEGRRLLEARHRRKVKTLARVDVVDGQVRVLDSSPSKV